MEDEESICRDLGFRVRELRRAKGWTQQELADRLEVEAREVRRIEAGENTTVYTLVRFARALDAPVAALFKPPASRVKAKRGRPPTPTRP